MSKHYVHTKDGACQAIGLNTNSELARYKRNAIQEGYEPSKVIGGTEYFDIEQLLQNGDAEHFLEKQIEKQIKDAKNNSIQLTLVFK